MMISMGAPDRARTCKDDSNLRWLFGSSLTFVPPNCNEASGYGPPAVRYLALALDARELLVAVLGGIAQPRFGDTNDAPAPLVRVAQLMCKDCLQLAEDTISSRLKKVLGLFDARPIF